MKLGSLFDGIGGFPAAGLMCGIEPVWASEIEKFPCAVTAARFPKMKQLGDITQIDGGKIEPVDIITFGSPCQDLSVAGKQKGIHDGERSNLFFEAIRIIKEMRAATNNKYPRFAVWENVPGAQSSNKGEDFRSVIEAFISVVHDGVSIPRPEKWFRAGGVASDRFSLAWRMYDAQYWGVPQRRKRIYLVADFGSERAGEILLVSEGLRGNPAAGGETREGTVADAERRAGGSHITFGLTNRGYPAAFMGGQGAKARSIAYCDDGSTPTLKSAPSGGNTVPDVVYALPGNGIDRADTAGCNGAGWREGESYTLNTIDRRAVCYGIDQQGGKGNASYQKDLMPTLCSDSHGTPHAVCFEGQNVCANGESAYTLQAGRPDLQHIPAVVYDARGNGNGEIVPTCTGDHENRVTDYTAICVGNGQLHQTDLGEVSGALNCMHDQQAVVCPGVGISSPVNRSNPQLGDPAPSPTNDNRNYCLANGTPPRKYIVRRLTPLECLRLQGFPDTWFDGVEGSDSAKYKACGNSLAIPCAYDVLKRIADFVEQEDDIES